MSVVGQVFAHPGRALEVAALVVAVWLSIGAAEALGHGALARGDVLPGCTQQNDAMSGTVETSPNVEHLGWLPGEALDTTPGGRRVGDRFYITGLSHFSVYDIRNPAQPRLLSRINFQCRFENEDVAADGRSLIFSDFATNGNLFVYDVRDARQPRLVAEVPGAGTHTMTCVLGCRYLYGSYRAVSPAGPTSTGSVVDLGDPASPKVLGDWTEGGVLPSRKVHDVTEIAPGLVLSASAPIQLMDVRSDPVRPTVLARGPDPAKRWHSVEWPRQGLDRFVLASYETNATQRCEGGVGDFAVFDASRAAETGQLERRSTYLLTNTNDENSSGNPPFNSGLGCSPHWFEVRPSWRDGGVVALGAYDHGVKFLRVDPAGEIREVGHFRAPGTNASAAYWITCEIVYVVDYTRGLDVLRFRDAASACGPGDLPAGANPPGSRGTSSRGRPLERLRARVDARWRVGRRFTQLRRLTVTRVPLAATVRVRCRGGGCPRRTSTLVVRRGKATTRRMRRLRLRGGVVEVRISRPGATTQRVAWRIRARRAPRRVHLR